MTRAQTLAGAMGLASWRAHWTLAEYASAVTSGGALRSQSSRPRFNHALDPLGLNEVGVTDAVLATLWQFGPGGAAYGVSARAENRYFGADIAFVDFASKRILLYQAKLARLVGADLKLKSHVPVSHVGHLTRRTVRIGGGKYAVTGRLALYQTGHTPFLNHCAGLPFSRLPFGWPGFLAWRRWGLSGGPTGPIVGREYYEDVLLNGSCSPGGVLAAPVTSGGGQIDSVPTAQTWPWEFDIFHWHQRMPGPLDPAPQGSGTGDGERRPDDVFPEFTRYTPAQDGGVQVGDASEFADGLRQALRIPAGHALLVIAL